MGEADTVVYGGFHAQTSVPFAAYTSGLMNGPAKPLTSWLVEPMLVSSAISCTDWPCSGELVLMETVKFQMSFAMDVRNLLLTSVAEYAV